MRQKILVGLFAFTFIFSANSNASDLKLGEGLNSEVSDALDLVIDDTVEQNLAEDLASQAFVLGGKQKGESGEKVGKGKKKGPKAGKGKRGQRKGKLRKRIKRVCGKANLTSEQKQQVRAGIVALKKEQIMLMAQMKIARIDFRQTLFNEDASVADVETALASISKIGGELVTGGAKLKADLVANVFESDQVRPGLRCVTLKLKAQKRRAKRMGLGRGLNRGPQM